MYQLAKLVLKSYKPKKLEPGMLFLTNVGKGLSIIQINNVPRDEDEFLRTNGYPVEPYIIEEGNPNLNDGYVIAQPHLIAWWDDGDHTDELREITLKDYKRIIEEDHGYVYIDALENDDDNQIHPIIYEGQVVLSYVTDIHDDDDVHEDWEEFDETDIEYMLEGDEDWEIDQNHEDENNKE